MPAHASSPPDAATTGDEIASTSLPHQSTSSPPQKRTAFTDLMSPHKPSSKKAPPINTPLSDPARTTTFLGRNGLEAYTAAPETFPSSRVIYHSDSFVAINDLFPKSTLHLLLLPRSPQKQLLHPFDAFDDSTFLASVQEEVRKLKSLAAKELKRRWGRYSALEQAREAALERNLPASELPAGRTWEAEILAGIHAHPSMNHLHIHILSRDRYSECMRHRKHYNSFATPFLIPVEDFPLAEGDERRHPGRAGFLERDLVCWRCGRDFGRGFKALKEHLGEEFERWKRV